VRGPSVATVAAAAAAVAARIYNYMTIITIIEAQAHFGSGCSWLSKILRIQYSDIIKIMRIIIIIINDYYMPIFFFFFSLL
jgi:hypothetical protein